MSLIKVHKAEGALHSTTLNPANITHVESPSHQPGGNVAPYSSVIHLVGGKQVTAIEPREVVAALLGKSLMDSAGNPGYWSAVQDKPDDKTSWKLSRTDYEE